MTINNHQDITENGSYSHNHVNSLSTNNRRALTLYDIPETESLRTDMRDSQSLNGRSFISGRRTTRPSHRFSRSSSSSRSSSRSSSSLSSPSHRFSINIDEDTTPILEIKSKYEPSETTRRTNLNIGSQRGTRIRPDKTSEKFNFIGSQRLKKYNQFINSN